MIVSAYARLLGFVFGTRVDVAVTPAASAPLAAWGFGRLDAVRITGSPAPGRAPLPVQAWTVSWAADKM